MKVIFIENNLFSIKELQEQIDLNEFLKTNKLVIISEILYDIDEHSVNQALKLNLNIKKDNVIFIALGKLIRVVENNEFVPINNGIGFDIKDLIIDSVNYYQLKYKEIIDEISFFYKCFKLSDFKEACKLNKYLKELNINNEEVLDFKKININFEIEKNEAAGKRKLTFVTADNLYYGLDKKFSMDIIKEETTKYLEKGNILSLLTYNGNYYGYPFLIENNSFREYNTNKQKKQYLKLLEYFRSLNIIPDQVSNFKVSHTGLNINLDNYKFGFDWYNIDSFFIAYLNYLRNKGYFIDDVYLIDKMMGSWISFKTKKINEMYKLFYTPTQEEYNKVLKKINK